ncbi:MAG TPA: methyltransferase domain-containing protein [Steroidobacteraceae bacterium]|jgi:SAM-dependent methyltransferase|nr:methyltransferase domain-containing protein [Steroidobacteraceae bacterium]
MSVFDSQYADQYDLLYAQKDYCLECDLVESAATRFATVRPNTILDVGCGTGQHAIELAARGYKLTGVDLSEAMLKHAQAKSASLQAGTRPRWLQGNARDFDAGTTYDMAIMMFAVIGYLTPNAHVLEGLRNIRRHLSGGGIFACDFWYGPTVLTDRPTDRVRTLPTEGGEVIRSTRTALNILQHTADVTFRLWETRGKQVVSDTCETHRMRYFFPQEFALLLSSAGFELLQLSAFPSLDAPLSDATFNAFAVARAV